MEEVFDLLFDVDIFSLMETRTNEKIRKRIEVLTKHKEHLFESSKYPQMKPANVSELRALVCPLYYRGLYRMNYHRLNFFFSGKEEPPIFSATMSRDCMKFVLSTLAFDDPEKGKEKWPYGHFATGRLILKIFNSDTSKYLLPSLYLSIDETLFSRHQITFRYL